MYPLNIYSRTFLLFSVSSSLLSVAQYSARAPCYFPDSSIAENFTSCSSTGNGDCCLQSDICTNWGDCVSQENGYRYRGACTDSTWEDPSCPDYCLGSSTGNSSRVNVIPCRIADTDGTWCCAYNGDCCTGPLTFLPGTRIVFAEPNNLLTTFATASGSASVLASTTVSTSTSSTTSDTSLSPTTTSSSSPATTSPTPPSSATTTSTATIVGAAVGVPLALAFITALFLLFRERKKHTDQNHEKKDFERKKLDRNVNDGVSPGYNSSSLSNGAIGTTYYASSQPRENYTHVENREGLGEREGPQAGGVLESRGPLYELWVR
ncbi:298399c0-4dc1-4dcd-b639-38ec0fc36529 [Sclerotinia trifoliorum]|uniref:298399c0-4dc1-4dcd-b639-38ec0fc36529 n=1 Tax=Sclerotinia trifoliorum TaxID=28548 RepID=A0A8H2VZB1_9HELO|nr:298399c0-4dc1-4dcd-b639-38ec0fc36529 [Sclerotinia trifoliorum]